MNSRLIIPRVGDAAPPIVAVDINGDTIHLPTGAAPVALVFLRHLT